MRSFNYSKEANRRETRFLTGTRKPDPNDLKDLKDTNDKDTCSVVLVVLVVPGARRDQTLVAKSRRAVAFSSDTIASS